MRDTSLIKQYRDMLGLAKTDENDALTLSIIQRDAFREITTEEVKLRKLLLQFELL